MKEILLKCMQAGGTVIGFFKGSTMKACRILLLEIKFDESTPGNYKKFDIILLDLEFSSKKLQGHQS